MTNLVNFELFFTKLSEIDTYEKRIDNPGGHAWGHFFMACHKLGAMAIYLVKQACVNDILASVSKLYIPSTLNIDLTLWHTQLIVCAENVTSRFKSWVFPFTFQAYFLPYMYIEL